MPTAPVMSRSKQATQMPMLPGFPSFCKRAARMPIIAPTATTPQRVAKKFFIFPSCVDFLNGRYINGYFFILFLYLLFKTMTREDWPIVFFYAKELNG